MDEVTGEEEERINATHPTMIGIAVAPGLAMTVVGITVVIVQGIDMKATPVEIAIRVIGTEDLAQGHQGEGIPAIGVVDQGLGPPTPQAPVHVQAHAAGLTAAVEQEVAVVVAGLHPQEEGIVARKKGWEVVMIEVDHNHSHRRFRVETCLTKKTPMMMNIEWPLQKQVGLPT